MLCFIFGGLGLLAFIFLTHTPQKSQDTFHTPIAQEHEFSIKDAPSKSLKAAIKSFSGEALWESRIATQPAQLTHTILIQQGEKLSTGKDGKITLSFTAADDITINPDSDLSIVQTLPSHIVLEQTHGTVNYANSDDSTLSIRTLHILTIVTQATMTIAVDDSTHDIVISVEKGNVTLAYNNKDNISTLINLSQGKRYNYNDDDRDGNIENM